MSSPDRLGDILFISNSPKRRVYEIIVDSRLRGDEGRIGISDYRVFGADVPDFDSFTTGGIVRFTSDRRARMPRIPISISLN